ncbi:predicted protein [Histoplasma capsulatum var. duboisii H88]|uniref:Predicted protein n=1 Tax=Ajellomyces capsulatus (strain H88) TaxID=544711 RepID=F0UK21_AJEC8|nr:predicted protein [Histoplasma capsulatum var. duboisii H88]
MDKTSPYHPEQPRRGTSVSGTQRSIAAFDREDTPREGGCFSPTGSVAPDASRAVPHSKVVLYPGLRAATSIATDLAPTQPPLLQTSKGQYSIVKDGGGFYFEMRKELLIFVSPPRVTPKEIKLTTAIERKDLRKWKRTMLKWFWDTLTAPERVQRNYEQPQSCWNGVPLTIQSSVLIRCIISLWGIADRSIAGSIYHHSSQSSPEIAVLVSRFYHLLIKHPTKAEWIPCIFGQIQIYIFGPYISDNPELCYRYIPEPIYVELRNFEISPFGGDQIPKVFTEDSRLGNTWDALSPMIRLKPRRLPIAWFVWVVYPFYFTLVQVFLLCAAWLGSLVAPRSGRAQLGTVILALWKSGRDSLGAYESLRRSGIPFLNGYHDREEPL